MCRRVLTAEVSISAESARTAEEVTPAVTAVASIASEASGARLPPRSDTLKGTH